MRNNQRLGWVQARDEVMQQAEPEQADAVAQEEQQETLSEAALMRLSKDALAAQLTKADMAKAIIAKNEE